MYCTVLPFCSIPHVLHVFACIYSTYYYDCFLCIYIFSYLIVLCIVFLLCQSLPADFVTVTPELPEMSVVKQDRSITIQGRSQPNTTYTITFSGEKEL